MVLVSIQGLEFNWSHKGTEAVSFESHSSHEWLQLQLYGSTAVVIWPLGETRTHRRRSFGPLHMNTPSGCFTSENVPIFASKHPFQGTENKKSFYALLLVDDSFLTVPHTIL